VNHAFRRTCGGILLGLALSACSTSAPPRDLIGEYRRADFGSEQSFPVLEDSYRKRIALEFEIIRSGRIGPLREALGDPNRFVRAFSVAGLGILGDGASVEAISKLVADPDTMVGVAALQALGWLKDGKEAVQSAKAKSPTLSRHLVTIAERQIEDSIDHAAKVRQAYQLGLRREEVGSAVAGKPAPDFTATDTDGNPFRLADAVLKNKVVILIFVSADW